MAKSCRLGGSVNDEDTSTASLTADIYDPVSNTMSSAGSNIFARLYHSVALLMPDATVWFAGGNPNDTYEKSMEIYQPPYLFTKVGNNVVPATRPTITSAPAHVDWGSGTFTVVTPDAADITQVVIVRNGAVTHAFNIGPTPGGPVIYQRFRAVDRDRAPGRQHRAPGLLHAVPVE